MPTLEPLGDQGVLARFVSEDDALRWGARVRQLGADWLHDVVQAYTTVAVFHDPDRVSVSLLLRQLEALPTEGGNVQAEVARTHAIPCCYALGLDLERIARHTGLTCADVVRLHSETVYTVYAIGFCPGFPYLGYLPEPLCGVPRLQSPRLRVEPGSVGLTGRQTGIYTEARPGGWSLVGRTPLLLVDVASDYFPLRTGDRVRFTPIDEAEWRRLQGQRLSL